MASPSSNGFGKSRVSSVYILMPGARFIGVPRSSIGSAASSATRTGTTFSSPGAWLGTARRLGESVWGGSLLRSAIGTWRLRPSCSSACSCCLLSSWTTSRLSWILARTRSLMRLRARCTRGTSRFSSVRSDGVRCTGSAGDNGSAVGGNVGSTCKSAHRRGTSARDVETRRA